MSNPFVQADVEEVAKLAETNPDGPSAEELAQQSFELMTGDGEPEQAAPEQTPQIPQKFEGKTREEIIESYEQLQRKLGQQQQEPQPQAEDPTKPSDFQIPEKPAPADSWNLDKYNQEMRETGDISDESRAELQAKGLPLETINEYITNGRDAAAYRAQKLNEISGGRLPQIHAWAQSNLSDAEQQAFNSEVSSGDAGRQEFALRGIVARFEASSAGASHFVEGLPSAGGGIQPITSDYDLQAAMKDPRYGKDPQYTRDLEARVARGMQ